jgi:hypothetical protein
MLSRLLILSLLIPASVAPAAAQSSPDKIAPPPEFHFRVPPLSQNAQVNSFLSPSPQVTFNLSPTAPHTNQSVNPNSPLRRRFLTLAQNAGPCYAIRSYRFTRDHPNSDTTTFADYSTCQPGSQFHVKAAVATPSR